MMLHNISRRRWTAMSVFFVGLMMILSPLNVTPALASEGGTYYEFDISCYVTGNGSGEVRPGVFTAKINFDDNDRVSGTAELHVGYDVINMSLGAVEFDGDGRPSYLEFSSTSNQLPAIAEFTVSPEGIVVIAVLML